MNILQIWTHTPWARAVGWSLIHFLWEGAAVAAVLAVLLFLNRRATSRFRYAISCLALLVMPVAFGITLAVLRPHEPIRIAPPLSVRFEPVSDGGGQPVSPPTGPWRGLPWLGPLWMAGVVLCYLRSLAGWFAARRLCRAGVCAAPEEWRARLDRLRDRLRLSRPVLLLESCMVDVPVMVGLLRPAILIPAGLLAGLPPDLLESILVHELAHIRRHDYLVNLLQSFIEGLLFYHPAVWWVSGRIRAERENCCDDTVVDLSGDARAYAAALATLERNRHLEPALAATGGSLMKRIRRLIQEPEGPRAATAPVLIAGLLFVSLGIALAEYQTKPAPSANAVPVVAHVPIASPAPSVLAMTTRQPVPEMFRFLAQVQANPQQDEKERALKESLKSLHQLVQLEQTNLAEQVQIAQQTDDTKQRALREALAKTQQALEKLRSPYTNWLNQDVAYIITDQERATFKGLQTDAQREQFIQDFWLQRDPTPGTPENEFKEEHYRRIAYANEHFASGIPGWKTDRGRIYIVYGPPDELESHPKGDDSHNFPYEVWEYRMIQDVGNNVLVEFIDPTRTGEFQQTTDPSPALQAMLPKAGTTITVSAKHMVHIEVPVGAYSDRSLRIAMSIVDAKGKPVTNSERVLPPNTGGFARDVVLAPGTYRLAVAVEDINHRRVLATDDLTVEVPF